MLFMLNGTQPDQDADMTVFSSTPIFLLSVLKLLTCQINRCRGHQTHLPPEANLDILPYANLTDTQNTGP